MSENTLLTLDHKLDNEYNFLEYPGNTQKSKLHSSSQLLGKITHPSEYCGCCHRSIPIKYSLFTPIHDNDLINFGLDFLNLFSFLDIFTIVCASNILLFILFNYIFFSNNDGYETTTIYITQIVYSVMQILMIIVVMVLIMEKYINTNTIILHDDIYRLPIYESDFTLLIKDTNVENFYRFFNTYFIGKINSPLAIEVRDNKKLKKLLEKYKKLIYQKIKLEYKKDGKLESVLNKINELKSEIYSTFSVRDLQNAVLVLFESQEEKEMFIIIAKELTCEEITNNISLAPQTDLANYDNLDKVPIYQRSTTMFYLVKLVMIMATMSIIVVPKLLKVFIGYLGLGSYIKYLIFLVLQVAKKVLNYVIPKLLKPLQLDNLYVENLLKEYYSSTKSFLSIFITIYLMDFLLDDSQAKFISLDNKILNTKFDPKDIAFILFLDVLTSLVNLVLLKFPIMYIHKQLMRVMGKHVQKEQDELYEHNEINIFKFWGVYRNMVIGCTLITQLNITLGLVCFSIILFVRICFTKYYVTNSAVKKINHYENGFVYILENDMFILLLCPFLVIFNNLFILLLPDYFSVYSFYLICGLFNYDMILHKLSQKHFWNRKLNYSEVKGNMKNENYKFEKYLMNKKETLENYLNNLN
jgi:hypothetical protein